MIGESTYGPAVLETDGDIKIEIQKAQAGIFYMKAIKVWQIVISSPAFYKKFGKEGSVHLFFSRDFRLKKGKYPVTFNYLGKKDTLGGSFSYHEKQKKTIRFSFDTQGEATFTKVDKTVEGEFSFKVFSKSKEARLSVVVSGKFSAPKKLDFPNGSPAEL